MKMYLLASEACLVLARPATGPHSSKRLTTEALTSSLATPFIPNLKARISEVSKYLVLKYRVQQTSTCVMVWLLILEFSTIYKPKQASLIHEEKYRDT